MNTVFLSSEHFISERLLKFLRFVKADGLSLHKEPTGSLIKLCFNAGL